MDARLDAVVVMMMMEMEMMELIAGRDACGRYYLFRNSLKVEW